MKKNSQILMNCKTYEDCIHFKMEVGTLEQSCVLPKHLCFLF